jgi:hypothetical protein
MPETFLRYLSGERDRLDQALTVARSAEVPDVSEIAGLQRQRRIVEDQLERWTADLSEAATAA